MEDSPRASRPVHTSQLRIRWGDMDAMGHVNNARFFTFFEQTRLDWLGTLFDQPLRSTRSGPILAHASCDFKYPIVYPATLEIRLYCDPPGHTSLTTHYEVYTDTTDRLSAVGKGVLVWIDLKTGRPTPLPDELRSTVESALAEIGVE